MSSPLQVAVGVVKSADGKILISRRHADLYQGGLWEFPGGKIEAGESIEQALGRELKEELNVTVLDAEPLITIRHRYPDRFVELHVYLVERFTGEAESCEGQPFIWAGPDELKRYAFPAANRPIVTAVRLPPHYAVLDEAGEDELIGNLNKLLKRGIKLIQARLKTMPASKVLKFIEQAYPLCRQQGAVLLLNSAADCPAAVDGIHLTGRDLMALTARPANVGWLAASCHNSEQLQHAEKLGVDFAVLAPVLPTQTHPGAPTLGWQRFEALVAEVNLPVYALGGMNETDLTTARKCGGQGIAAIRAFLA